MRSDKQEIKFPSIDQFAAEMHYLSECILENKPTRVPGEEGLRDITIIQAIDQSIKTWCRRNLA